MRRRLIIVILAALAASTAAGAEDRSALISAMDRYIQNPRAPGTYRALAGLGDPDFMAATTDEASSSWEEEKRVRDVLGLDWGGDCRTDYAFKTYRERVARLGVRHRYVEQWVKAQRAVFSACKGWSTERRVDQLPPPIQSADADVQRLQRADRAYQAASQLFYRSKIADARSSFAAIAVQKGPHQSAAVYMVAAIDGGSRPNEYQPGPPRTGAVAQAKALLTSPKTAGMRAEAHGLVGWIGATADTRETRAAQVAVTLEALHLPLATIRSDPQAAARYRRSADDLPALWTEFDNSDWWLTGAVPKDYFGSLAMAEAAKKDRLAAFQLVPGPCRAESCRSNAHGFQEYVDARQAEGEKAGDRDAWRAASAQLSYSYVPADYRAEIGQLIGRVQRAPTDHDVALLMLLADQQLHSDFDPTYRYNEGEWRKDRRLGAALLERWPWPESNWFTQRYSDSLRILAGNGLVTEARALRDRVGPRVASEYSLVSGELVLLLAEDQEHFVQALVAKAPAASALIDRLPIARLQALAADRRIEQADRARFARIAWTRAFLIDKRIPKDLDRLMRSLNPDVAAAWHSKIGARATDHALLLDVLRTPAMNLRAASRAETGYRYDSDEALKPADIDVYEHSTNNWWCGPIAEDYAAREEGVLSDALGDGAPRAKAERTLGSSWVWQSLDRNERAALAARPMAPRSLAEAAVAWGQRANPRRPEGADEALALAVRATRYGCQFQGGHGRWSRAAWDVLHQRFPDSAAARRTRWWFDCKHFTYGCDDATKDDQAYLPWPDEQPADAPAIKPDQRPAGG